MIAKGIATGFGDEWIRFGATSEHTVDGSFSERTMALSVPYAGLEPAYRGNITTTQEELVSRVRKGLYISEVMGLHTLDPITGEFSLGAFGQQIENGALTRPVTGIGFAGTVGELLGNIVGVASDLRLLPSGSAGSTVLVTGISISGT